ncbi:MAG: FixH family protein, partial [Bacteroidota bacterium]
TDGGPQIVEDYYTQAADWNDTMRVQASTLRLGWQANVRLDDRFGSSEFNSIRTVLVELSDSAGLPVLVQGATLRLNRPQLAKAVGEVPLAEVPGTPGQYTALAPISMPGLWDLTVIAGTPDAPFRQTVRLDVMR